MKSNEFAQTYDLICRCYSGVKEMSRIRKIDKEVIMEMERTREALNKKKKDGVEVKGDVEIKFVPVTEAEFEAIPDHLKPNLFEVRLIKKIAPKILEKI